MHPTKPSTLFPDTCPFFTTKLKSISLLFPPLLHLPVSLCLLAPAKILPSLFCCNHSQQIASDLHLTKARVSVSNLILLSLPAAFTIVDHFLIQDIMPAQFPSWLIDNYFQSLFLIPPLLPDL